MIARIVVFALAACALSLTVDPTSAQSPRFRADGPDADAFGRRDGYPHCKGADYFRHQRCRVGAFSHFDRLFPARTIAAPKKASRLKRARSEPNIRYSFLGQNLSLDQYLDRNPITGLLIAKDDTILVERYQYGRNDKHRLTSFSMAKTITGMLIGIAVKEGAIRSIDDPAQAYVPGLKGTEYGRSSIKSLLQMSSGVSFIEAYTNPNSDIAVLGRLTLGQDRRGSLGAVKHFNKRVAEPGARYSYSSAETLVLGLVLSHATRRNVSSFASDSLWKPLGAEASASWTLDGSGQEIAFAYFNAVLRDWARLGLMLAHDGRWQGKSIVPSEWVRAATTIAPGDSRLRSAAYSPPYGYGYQTWIFPGPGRMFAMRGYRGQHVLVDSDSKVVLVQTAARPGNDPLMDRELRSLWEGVLASVR